MGCHSLPHKAFELSLNLLELGLNLFFGSRLFTDKRQAEDLKVPLCFRFWIYISRRLWVSIELKVVLVGGHHLDHLRSKLVRRLWTIHIC